MRSLAASADGSARVYLTGGSTAVLLGWRESTVDVDLRIIPENQAMLRAIPGLKEQLDINVELASPADFIPEDSGWQDRSTFILEEGRVTFYHYDYYAQALSKIERFHERDVQDIRELLNRNLVQPEKLREMFDHIEPLLFRFPAISPKAFRANLESVLADFQNV